MRFRHLRTSPRVGIRHLRSVVRSDIQGQPAFGDCNSASGLLYRVRFKSQQTHRWLSNGYGEVGPSPIQPQPGQGSNAMRQPSLSYLLPNDWTLLSSNSERLKFRLGQEIIHAGSRLSRIYIIRRGSASVELPTADSTATLAVLEEGDVCGEIAFLGDGIATAAVIARDMEVEVEAIPVHDLLRLLRRNTGFWFSFVSLTCW
jgi:hypothetical protein